MSDSAVTDARKDATAIDVSGDGAARELSVASKTRLAVEILLAYARVRWTLRGAELPRVVASLRVTRRASRGLSLTDPVIDGVRLGAAIVRTLEPLPADSRCLMRSLVLLRLLARRGAAGSLVIAVRPNEDLSLGAHAWIEFQGRPLLAPATADHGRLLTL
jgi:hypothetical protein